jgi:hypothetical protein
MRRAGTALLSALGPVLGWALVPVLLLDQSARTYLELAAALPRWLWVGALAGGLTGLGQALAWRRLGWPAAGWFWRSLLGYVLMLPASLVIFALVPLLFGVGSGFPLRLPLNVPGSLTYYLFPASVIPAGFLAGLCQWPSLRALLRAALPSRPPTPAMHWLWVLGVWLGIGLGLFLGGYVATLTLAGLGLSSAAPLYPLLHGAAWGATIGLVSGAVLWIIRRAPGGHAVANS